MRLQILRTLFLLLFHFICLLNGITQVVDWYNQNRALKNIENPKKVAKNDVKIKAHILRFTDTFFPKRTFSLHTFDPLIHKETTLFFCFFWHYYNRFVFV